MNADRLLAISGVSYAQDAVGVQGWVGLATIGVGSSLALIALFRRGRATLLHGGRAHAGRSAARREGGVANDRDLAAWGGDYRPKVAGRSASTGTEPAGAAQPSDDPGH